MSQRGLRWGALLLLVAIPGVRAHARTHHSEAWARDRYAAADRMREALNGRPPAERTRHDYQRVLNAYRNVYYGAPTSSKADPSAVAVAETLVEMGRRFDDESILKEAIAQYRFLRKEYPGSKYRCDALFTIGEIYKDDLNDPEQARSVFEEFLHRYPQNRLAEDAQQAVIELDEHALEEKRAAAQKKPAKEVAGKTTTAKSKTAKDDTAKEADALPDAAHAADGAKDTSERHSGHLPRVTAIRHWSTPDYTRVAIDLESEIKFGSQRIAHPDRIFFDLRDTKLASTLVGKSFDVDDGFLKKIRVAQFAPGRTRVVLEVDDLSDYDAFLLPNPYRLIIDIHGKDARGKDARNAHPRPATETTADVEAAPKAGSKSEMTTAAEVKAALLAQAGKAPVTREDMGDDTRVVPKGEAGAKAHAPDAEQAAATGKAPALPTKVVVEASDDDPPPAKASKRNKTTHSAASPTSIAAGKKDDTDDSDYTVGDESSADSAALSHARGKSSSRLGAARNSGLNIHEARPTASGDRSLIRALGLKIGRIVIDPGHGGHDTGTIGPNGLQEKDLVLEVGRRLGKLLEARLGAEVVYTRKDDTFIPLETRTAIANQQRADLFISIHANSSGDPDARGVETYYLNFTSSPEALEVAARENAVSEKSIYELQDLVKKIALKEKIEESREFAGDVQESLHSGLATKSPAIRNRGVKKAPFIVLIGANMPSILAEISFVSNPTDEHRLETSEYRERIAESLYHGIAKYVDGLSGVKMASKMDKAAGQ